MRVCMKRDKPRYKYRGKSLLSTTYKPYVCQC